jgi:transcriptional regulator with XRE-family HTH domain
MEFGQRVRVLMKQRGVNNKQLAEAIEENATSVTSYLNGNRQMRAAFIFKIINFFPEADLNWLFRNDTSGLHPANEDQVKYKVPKTPENLITNMEEELKELKALLAQK